MTDSVIDAKVVHETATESVRLERGPARVRVAAVHWTPFVARFLVEPQAGVARYLDAQRTVGGKVSTAERRALEAAAWQVAEARAADAMLARVAQQELELQPAQARLLERYQALLLARMIAAVKAGVGDSEGLATKDRAAAVYAADVVARDLAEAGSRSLASAARTVDRSWWEFDADHARQISEQRFRYQIEHYALDGRKRARVVADRVSRARYRIGANSGDARFEMTRLVKRFRSGELTTSELRTQVRDVIRHYSTSSYRAGKAVAGVSSNLTKADQKTLLGLRAEEDKFLNGFLGDIQSSKYSDARALWRAEQYARGTGSQATANMGWLVGMADRGARVRWEYNPTAKHCPQCIERNGREWPADAVPVVPGRCPRCLSSCKCELVVVGSDARGPDTTPSSGPPPPMEDGEE